MAKTMASICFPKQAARLENSGMQVRRTLDNFTRMKATATAVVVITALCDLAEKFGGPWVRNHQDVASLAA